MGNETIGNDGKLRGGAGGEELLIEFIEKGSKYLSSKRHTR